MPVGVRSFSFGCCGEGRENLDAKGAKVARGRKGSGGYAEGSAGAGDKQVLRFAQDDRYSLKHVNNELICLLFSIRVLHRH